MLYLCPLLPSPALAGLVTQCQALFTIRHTSCPNSDNLHSSSAAKGTTPTHQGPEPTEAGPSWLIIHSSGAIQGLQPTVQQPQQQGTQRAGTCLSPRFQA